MTHTIQIVGDERDLLDLQHDLRSDPQVRGLQVARRLLPPHADELGPTTEALQWMSDNKEILAAAFGAVTSWVRSRRSKVKVRIDGREVEIDSTKLDDPVAAAENLVKYLQADQDK
jgi:hypothetical protein